jgi:hypothetical protein
MDQPFDDVLKRHAAAGRPLPPDPIPQTLDAACRWLADLLEAFDPSVRQDLLAQIQPWLADLLDRKAAEKAAAGGAEEKQNGPPPEYLQLPGPPPMKLTPELIEWYRQQTNVEEVLAQLRDVERTGGLELRDFIHELEEAAGPDE